MPIYEYQCEKCGTFEVTQRITEKPLGRCPTCKGKVKKLISNTSFQLKGTGWYVTDYARKDKSSSEKTAKGEKVAKTETKTESKAGAESDGGKKDSTEKTTTKPAASESTGS
jgi:putative FmdB family regulatory protein